MVQFGARACPSTDSLETTMFRTAIAGSLPKPSWLAETHKLWPQWRAQGEDCPLYTSDAADE